ncbi:hypothetical protein [Natronorubrum sp. FCH18a]|uniref:hypothetical protein n=1 Tax=Natronorubrum sp. FCH18a TaxID=3447018 RepID=UPI003F518F4A
MKETNGCDDNRIITFASGEKVEPTLYGKEERDKTYQEMIKSYEQQIKNGGRGNLSAEQVRTELENFKDQWEEEEFENRACHDCGVEKGEYHHPGCDWEECPRCRRQYLSCDCITEEKDEIWLV